MASIPYCEHVGVYLQEGPSSGDNKYWYPLISPIKIQLSALSMFFY
jgi:hypothetical protein